MVSASLLGLGQIRRHRSVCRYGGKRREHFHRENGGLGVVILLGASLLNACVYTVDFNPEGSEGSMAAAWTISGEAPTEANCKAHGIRYIQVSFFDGSRRVDHDELRFDCQAGSLDTTRSENEGWSGNREQLRAGTYTLSLLALEDDEETPRDEGFLVENQVIEAGFHLLVPSSDFRFEPVLTEARARDRWEPKSAAMTLRWRFPTEADTCGSLGVSSLQIWVSPEGAETSSNLSLVGGVSCSETDRDGEEYQAVIPDARLRAGRYQWQVLAVSPELTTLLRSESGQSFDSRALDDVLFPVAMLMNTE